MKKFLVYTLVATITNATHAQTVSGTIVFKQGDRYQKEIFTNSETLLYCGNQMLNTNSKCAIYRDYTITDTARNSYTFTITTKKLIDTIGGMGLQMRYSSETPIDTASFIEKDLDNVIDKTIVIVFDKNGSIKSHTQTYSPDRNDSLLTLTGLIPDESIQGNFTELTTRCPPIGLYRKGASWTDSVFTTNCKEVIHYTIESISDTASIVNFTGISVKRYDFVQNQMPFKYYFFTNINGKMSIDNSGIITARLTKTASTGRGSINGISVSIKKRRSVWENVKKQ